MENYIPAEDYELWMLIKNGPLIPTKVKKDGTKIHKKPEEFNSEDYKMMEKNAKVKKLLYFGLGPDEYTRICECKSAKDIWDALQVAHEGTNQSLGKTFTTEELVRKILRFLRRTWEAKVTAIQEAKDLKTISLDELIGNLQTYELRRNSRQQEETRKDHGIAPKVMEEDSSYLDDEHMDMLARKFKKFFKKSKERIRKKHPSKFKSTDREQFSGCFKCGKFHHS